MPANLPDRDELLAILGERARAGQVTAVKLLLEEFRRDDTGEDTGSGFDALDELQARRDSKAS